MAEPFKIVLALLASALAPVLCVFVYFAVGYFLDYQRRGSVGSLNGMEVLCFFAFLIALAHAVLLGLPYFTILKKRNQVRWWTSLIGGFLVGFLPLTLWLVFTFQSGGSSFSSGSDSAHGDAMVADGHLTLADWLGLLSSGAMFGVLGALGGLAAWAVWRFVPSKAK